MKFKSKLIPTCIACLFLCLFVFKTHPVSGQVRSELSAEEKANSAKAFLSIAKEYVPSSLSMRFEFKGAVNRFGHLTKPWETSERQLRGSFSLVKGDGDLKLNLQESVLRDSKTEESTSVYSEGNLLRLDDQDRPEDTTRSDQQEFLRTSCRYTPLFLVQHVIDTLEAGDSNTQNISISALDNQWIAEGMHGEETFELYFQGTKYGQYSLNKIVWHLHHEMWGDQEIEFNYSAEKKIGEFRYPSNIIERTFENTTFQCNVLDATAMNDADIAKLPEIPDDYRVQPDPDVVELIEIDKYSERITFLHVTHTDSRTTVVEFDEFLLVIDAPVSSRNGQLILDKIRELGFSKPVKYFAFGHHHPHYLAGVRPFIAERATVLTTEKIVPYLHQIAKHQHSRQPDALQENPADLIVQTFEDEIEITDGQYAMQVFDIGMKSQHTIDYLLFYFPEEKMILQGDGIWLRPNQPARARTKAIYDAIVDRKLDVMDCIQGWPTQNYDVETKIKFNELEAAVNFEAPSTTDDEQEEKAGGKKASEDKDKTDQEVFESLKLLVGKWRHESKNEVIDYSLISRDSALVENWSWPDRGVSGMTVYHMDGDKLMATHYCPVGNQPRLIFDSTTDDGKHVFNFDSATNLTESMSRCTSFWLRSVDETTLFRSETYADDKESSATESRYLRVPKD